MNLQWKGGEFKLFLWKCANSLTVVEFNKHMGELKKYNKKAYEWLKKFHQNTGAGPTFQVFTLQFSAYEYVIAYT